MIPDTSLIMGFRYKGKTSYITTIESSLPFAVIAGLRKSVQIMKDEKNTGNLLVVFNAMGAHAFMKESLHHFYGAITPLNDCNGFGEMNEVEDRLCAAVNDNQRIKIGIYIAVKPQMCRFYKSQPYKS